MVGYIDWRGKALLSSCLDAVSEREERLEPFLKEPTINMQKMQERPSLTPINPPAAPQVQPRVQRSETRGSTKPSVLLPARIRGGALGASPLPGRETYRPAGIHGLRVAAPVATFASPLAGQKNTISPTQILGRKGPQQVQPRVQRSETRGFTRPSVLLPARIRGGALGASPLPGLAIYVRVTTRESG